MPSNQARRKPRSLRLDSRIWDAIAQEATFQGIAVNRWIEINLFDLLQEKGLIPRDAKRLAENRGGDRRSRSVSEGLSLTSGERKSSNYQ